MLILAIDLVGIHPFKQPKRIVLKPGMNTVLGPNGSGKSMACGALSVLLMNTPPHHMALIGNMASQVAITFQGKDGGVYRIARDFRKADWLFSKMDAATQKFATPENEPEKILLWLRNMTGGLDEKERNLLFLIDRFRLPSQGRSAQTATLPLPEYFSAPIGSGPEIESDTLLPDLPPPGPEVKYQESESSKTQELQDLEKKLGAMEEEHDTLLQKQDQAKSIRNRIARWHELEEKRIKIEEAESHKYDYFVAEGPLDPNRLRDFEEGEKEKANDLITIEEERRLLQADLAVLQDTRRPQWKNPMLLSGGGIIVFSFLLPFIVTLSGPYRYLFLLGILGGSGLAAFGYYKIIRRMAVKRTLKNTLAKWNEKAQEIEKKFEEDHRAVLSYFAKTGTKDLTEFKGLQTAYATLIKKKEAAQIELARVLDGQSLETLEAQADQLEQEAMALSEKLKGLEEISREVYRLQEDLRKEDTDIGSLEATFFPDGGYGPAPLPGEDSFFSAVFSIKNKEGRPFQRGLMNQHALQIYRYFQNGSQEILQVKEDGAVYLGERPLNHLSPGIADQVFLSLALSALVQFSNLPFPLILDDPFSRLDSPSKSIAGKLLQQIAKQRQVILFSTEAPPAPNGGHISRLD